MNEENVNAGAINEPVGTETKENTGNKPVSFDDFLKGDGNQAEFDRRVQKAIETAKTKWQEINDAEKSEAEKLEKMNKEQKLEYEAQKANKEKENALAELNAYKLKEQATKIASEKGVDVSLLDLIDFRTITAEKLTENIENLSNVFKRAVEKSVNEKLREDTPTTKIDIGGSQPKPIPNMF